ncbi:hypothetical protein [Streptomyces sp. NPDC097981]
MTDAHGVTRGHIGLRNGRVPPGGLMPVAVRLGSRRLVAPEEGSA